MRDADDEPPRDAPVRPCEWPSENFMDRAGIKEEFNAYLRNADLVSFEADKCRQYHYLTSSFVRRFELLEDKQRFKLGGVDTSPSYLLFQTLLPLFWTLTCMI